MTRPFSKDDILVATIGRPHGIRGLVRLHSALESAEMVEALGLLHDEKGRFWRIEWRGEGIAALLTKEGVALADRNEAEKMVNCRLYVPREALPEIEDDSFYHTDLIGMDALSPNGEALGKVVIVHDYGAGTSLELSSGHIVPFTHACVPDIDLKNRSLTIILPEFVEVEGDLSGEVQIRS